MYSPFWKITHQNHIGFVYSPLWKWLFLVGAYFGVGVCFGKDGKCVFLQTRIKDEVLIEDGEEKSEQAVVVYNEHTVAVTNGDSAHAHDSTYEPPQFGHADEEEYVHGERDGVTYVQKKSRKYEQGPAGLTSKIEESRSEEVIFDESLKQHLESICEKNWI